MPTGYSEVAASKAQKPQSTPREPRRALKETGGKTQEQAKAAIALRLHGQIDPREKALAEATEQLAAAQKRAADVALAFEAAHMRAVAAEQQCEVAKAAQAKAEAELAGIRASATAKAKKALQDQHQAQLEALKSAHAQRQYQAVRCCDLKHIV